MTSTQPLGSETDDRTNEIIEAIAPLLAHHRQRWAARCHARGISILGFQLLALLEMHGAMPMSHLADELGVALPNATGLVNRMAERGLVGRHDDSSDRRIVRVELTVTGQRLIEEVEAERRERMRQLFGILGPSQQERLLHAVRDLSAAARQLRINEEVRS